MIQIFSRSIFLLILVFWCTINSSAQNLKKVFADTEKQTTFMLGQIDQAKEVWLKDVQNKKKPEVVSPRNLSPDGTLNLVAAKDWTSGFFPGVLWFLYEFTGKPEWEKQARRFTENLENEKMNGATHDMGFKIYDSFGAGYRLTNDLKYKEVILQGARTLSTRFRPVVGCIRSWDHSKDKWSFPVIIDNMMNLELLFEATRMTGDSSFYKIAVTHANTTMKNHFRPDFSSYHVIGYDTITGKVLQKNTHQGYSHESAWARGQAWGLYGFTMCYRETKDPKYLQLAENIAGFILNHPNLPKDLVPYWDFNAPNIPNEPRDVSAAAVIASGLYELSTYSKNGKLYRDKANQIVKNLTSDYRSPVGENHGFLLLHSTGSKPSNSEVDVPIIYADYYYLEALIRARKIR
ncbi:MAG: glycoside hydrolase family 88 protein [Mariniphaga sp.]